jgi:hypothetical protein
LRGGVCLKQLWWDVREPAGWPLGLEKSLLGSLASVPSNSLKWSQVLLQDNGGARQLAKCTQMQYCTCSMVLWPLGYHYSLQRQVVAPSVTTKTVFWHHQMSSEGSQ